MDNNINGNTYATGAGTDHDMITGEPLQQQLTMEQTQEAIQAQYLQQQYAQQFQNQQFQNQQFQNQQFQNQQFQNQQQYGQQYGNAPYPQGYVQGQAQMVHPDNTNPTAKRLCWASLICWILPKFISTAVMSNVFSINYDFDGFGFYGILFSIGSAVISMMGLAAYVLIIIERIKYPQNKFGKALMWVYIVELILFVLAAIVVFAFAAYLLHAIFG